ncbi:MAG TPA: hypothetical protein VF230_12770 [Acidimicrobiales bacterium]
MSTASRIGAAFGAGLLGLALLAGPAMADPDGERPKKQNGTEATDADAAPGNADRETEAGGSGTQGRSESNPDGDPGVDKPYPAAGHDAETQGDSDYDGNNGCGNDTDFADDNNGNCGGNRENAGAPVGELPKGETEVRGNTVTKPVTPAQPAELGAVDTETTEAAQVLGVQFERAATTQTAAVVKAQPAELGAVDTSTAAAPLTLARTGLPLVLLAIAGFGLIGGGVAFRRFARR